ncbi:unnamed protein product [Alopecurus aequalis]
MDWQPEQLDLGALGFAGICRETFRVLHEAILPSTMGTSPPYAPLLAHIAAVLSALLLAHIATNRALLSLLTDTDDGSHLVRIVARMFTLSSSSERILQNLPRAPVRRLRRMFQHVVPASVVFILLSSLAWSALMHIEDIVSNEAVVRALQVLSGSACLASVAYVAVVSHISCVVAALEDAVLLGAVRKSRALLAGKFWVATVVFIPLDACFIALQISFLELVLEDTLGLGSVFQGVVGAAMAVALWAVLVVTLAAQPVVYLVCKNHHNEVVDMVHLDYVGDYERLNMDDDSGVELQPVETVKQCNSVSMLDTY